MEILCISSRISRLQCSIIHVNLAIISFTGKRKPLNFEILARERRSSNGISFYWLPTTFYDFLYGAKFWDTFTSLIWGQGEFINMPVYNLTQSYSGKKNRRHCSKHAQPYNKEKERKLNIFYNISLDLEGLCGASFCFFFFFCSFRHRGGEISLSKISHF